MTSPLTARQRELFSAILSDFLAEGFANFTIDAAAKRYRCSKSTMYALGGTRDAIIRRILISFFKEITRRTAPIPGTANGTTSVEQALEQYFSSITTALSPASPKFMQDLATEAVAQEIFAINTLGAQRTIDELLSRGVASGEFLAEDIDFVSLLIRRAMNDIQLGVYHDTVPPGQAYRALGRVILRGIVK